MRLRRQRRVRRQGFTLLELLLVVALVMMLVSAMVFNFSSLLRANRLAEGTSRLETLLRYARAQAANSGRKVQLVFNSESTNAPAATGEVRATWEADPLGQPGCFTDIQDGQFQLQQVNDMVQVQSVKLLESNSVTPPATGDSEEIQDEDEMAAGPDAKSASTPITFYPDGSSDSAEIIVASKSAEEDQRMAVRLIGMTGSISHQLLTLDDGEVMDEAGPVDRSSSSIRRDPILEPDASLRPTGVRPTPSRPPELQPVPHATVGATNSFDKSE